MERWNIQNTGYDGSHITYETVGKQMSFTGTNGNNDFYTPPEKTSMNTDTITYDTAQTTYETSTTTMNIMDVYSTTTIIDGQETTAYTHSLRAETFNIKVLDVEIETNIYREEYVSMTYQRAMGGEWKQANNSYTDYYTYMITENFGGVSVSALEQTQTNYTYQSLYTYKYMDYGYSLDWSWVDTTTLTMSYSDKWISNTVQELVSFDTNGSPVYTIVDRGWYTPDPVYYETTTHVYSYGNWPGWWWYETQATRVAYTGGYGNLLVTQYANVTSNVNTYSKSYINKTTNLNRPVYLSFSGIQTLSNTGLFSPTNNSYSTTTFYHLGTMTIQTTTKTTTWELL